MSNVVVSVGVFQSLVSVAAGAGVGRSPVHCWLGISTGHFRAGRLSPSQTFHRSVDFDGAFSLDRLELAAII